MYAYLEHLEHTGSLLSHFRFWLRQVAQAFAALPFGASSSITIMVRLLVADGRRPKSKVDIYSGVKIMERDLQQKPRILTIYSSGGEWQQEQRPST
jgi:hypothetical protein